VLKQSSPTSPDLPALLGGGTGVPKSKFKSGFDDIEVRVWVITHTLLVFDFGVRGAHTAFEFDVPSLPLSTADKTHNHALLLGEACLSTWTRSRSCEFRSPA
jgi:hypothetical protein